MWIKPRVSTLYIYAEDRTHSPWDIAKDDVDRAPWHVEAQRSLSDAAKDDVDRAPWDVEARDCERPPSFTRENF